MIPNFYQVDVGRNIRRGGQPIGLDYDLLGKLGISRILKLNTDSEGSDQLALDMGMSVFLCPISSLQQVLTEPDKQSLIDALDFIDNDTFIHCEHGQDRTGLLVAMYRVSKGWSKEAAEQEMLSLGFHKLLLGLWEFWREYNP